MEPVDPNSHRQDINTRYETTYSEDTVTVVSFSDEIVFPPSNTQEAVFLQSVSDTFPGDDELFKSYIDHFINRPAKDGKLPYSSGRLSSDEVTEAIISAAKLKISDIAEGNTDSSIVSITTADISDYVSDTALIRSYTLDQEHLTFILDVLLSECPYELYWYDKVNGCSCSTTVQGSKQTFTFQFAVSEDYYAQQATFPTSLDTAKTKKASAAAKNIAAIISGVQDNMSDYSVLEYFKDWLTEHNSYNNGTSGRAYGDPWQIIYAFDGDESTQIVCEGYSKAFKYLCDSYNAYFSSDIECRLVSGYISSGTGAGAHMWNVVELGGNNYLVDVTNCDSGFAFFMAGSTNNEYENNEYMAVTVSGIRFQYDESEVYSLYKPEEVEISSIYCPTYTVTWKNADGTTLETDSKVGLGETPRYNGEEPTAGSNYQFIGWDNTDPITKNTTITAQYEYIGETQKTIEYSKSDYSTVYDGSVRYPSSVVVTTPANSVVKYGTQEGVYDLDSLPGFTEKGTYTELVGYSAVDRELDIRKNGKYP